MTRQLLLCTDLDRTLLPNGPQQESTDARSYFAKLAALPDVTLAYVTGRHRELVEEAIEHYQLPQPAFVVSDVGSTIYEIQGKSWHHWEKWEAVIAVDWNGKSHEDLRNFFDSVSTLTLQEEAKQGRHKLSYYLPLESDHEAVISSMQSLLEQANIEAALVFSTDEISSIGLLDVLPACATKRHAIEFLMTELGFNLQNTLFAGDSGNDITVLASPIRAVLVANASAEVRNMAQQQAESSGCSDTLYLAKGRLLGMNGNYSAGILEGAVHYFPHLKSSIEN
jgi:sucrose-6F-phosphate phosphohydrolase